MYEVYLEGIGSYRDGGHIPKIGAGNTEHMEEIRDLRHHIQRLSLLNQALWELLCAQVGLKEDDLLRLAKEIDFRDGVEDGEITSRPVQCPSCLRVCSSNHHRCVYCSQKFERPVFG